MIYRSPYLLITLAAALFINACNPDSNYTVSFRNNSGFQLDELVLDHREGTIVFSLNPGETSQVFQIEAYDYRLIDRRNTCFGFTVNAYSDAVSTFENLQGCGLCLIESDLDPLGFNTIIINAPSNVDFDCGEFIFELEVL